MASVDEIYQDVSDLLGFLRDHEQQGYYQLVDGSFRKLLLIAAASYFEKRLSDAVIEIAEEVASNDHVIVQLIRRVAVERQYHTWFSWDARNANKFFSIFGDDFKTYAQGTVEENEIIKSSIADFMEIGRERNRMLHEDISSFFMEKTFDEIKDLYLSAKEFVDWFPNIMKEYLDQSEQ